MNFSETIKDNKIIENINFTNIACDTYAIIKDKNFININFKDSSLNYKFENCVFKNCTFISATIGGAFENCSFENCIFNKIELYGSSFINCVINNCSFNEFPTTYFQDTTITNCLFYNIIELEENLFFKNSKITSTQFKNNEFDNEIYFEDSELEKVIFSNSKIKFDIFSFDGSKINKTLFSNVKTNYITFWNAIVSNTTIKNCSVEMLKGDNKIIENLKIINSYIEKIHRISTNNSVFKNVRVNKAEGFIAKNTEIIDCNFNEWDIAINENDDYVYNEIINCKTKNTIIPKNNANLKLLRA